MSIELITGVPSSGKTYLASEKMYDIYKSKNRLIYTNINLKIDFDENIKSLDVTDLYKFATDEFNLFKEFTHLSNDYKKKHDDENDSIVLKKDDESIEVDYDNLLEEHTKSENEQDNIDDPFKKYFGNYDAYLKDSGILKSYGGSYIFWDECHNDLQGVDGSPKSDPIWVRFLSYHRHFDIDIVLITQDISLIHRKYKPFIAKYYFGQNPAKRFTTKTLKFKVYTDAKQYKQYYIETINVPMKKEIFAFYDSGEYTPSKSVLLKKLIPVFFIVFMLIGFYLYFFSSKHMEESKNVNVVKVAAVSHDANVTNDRRDDTDEYERESGDHIIFFNCNLINCTMRNSSFVIPLDSITSFSEAVGMKILYSASINSYYKLVAVSVTESLYNDLMTFQIQKKGDKHENGKMDFDNPTNKF